jgi:hypothetical protein
VTSHNGFMCWNSLGVFSAFNLGMFELLREYVQQEWFLKWMYVQVIACFLSLLYGYAGVSTSKKQIPDGIKGRIIHHSFPVTLFVVMMLSSTIHPPFSFFSVQRLCMNSLLNRSLLNGFSHFCPRCSCFSFYTWLKLVSNLIITPSEGWNEFHLPKKLFDLFCVFFCFVGYHSQRKQNLTRSH